jgi:hypothetical protein
VNVPHFISDCRLDQRFCLLLLHIEDEGWRPKSKYPDLPAREKDFHQ